MDLIRIWQANILEVRFNFAQSPELLFSCGREEDFCDTFALVQTLVKRYEAWEDTLLTLQTSNVYVHFSYKRPLIMCIVSRSPSNLSIELDLIRNQVLALLTKSILKDIYLKMGDNFDLRRWLDGIHKRVDACVKVFNEDPVVFLSGFRILPLNPLDRDFVIATMASAINEISPKVSDTAKKLLKRTLRSFPSACSSCTDNSWHSSA